ncbi:MAG: alanine racemase [Ilumatobacteraceae bacterium]
MTVRLTVQHDAWERHVTAVAGAVDGLVPVVKGNGYGYGRATLHPIAARLADRVCVGTVHELDHVDPAVTPIVLTPTLTAPASTAPILTVGAPAHVEALDGWPGRVVVKLRSSMSRYGVTPPQLDRFAAAVTADGLTIDGAAIHLPLAGDDATRVGEIEAWLSVLPTGWELTVSHLAADCFAALQRAHPERRLRLRAGTALWHGDKSFLHLGADVLDLHDHVGVDRDRVDHDDRDDSDGDGDGGRRAVAAGYHGTPVPDGTVALALVGAGSANGIAPLADGRSPFHFGRRRLPLLEPPHMHTSMCLVATDAPRPRVGDVVDVQRPLITTTVDELVWT